MSSLEIFDTANLSRTCEIYDNPLFNGDGLAGGIGLRDTPVVCGGGPESNMCMVWQVLDSTLWNFYAFDRFKNEKFDKQLHRIFTLFLY